MDAGISPIVMTTEPETMLWVSQHLANRVITMPELDDLPDDAHNPSLTRRQQARWSIWPKNLSERVDVKHNIYMVIPAKEIMKSMNRLRLLRHYYACPVMKETLSGTRFL